MPRKRKETDFQNENTAGRIFKQAMRLFLRKGYHGTTVDEIAEAAGFSKGAFYWYFKSKEDVLKEILRQYEQLRLDAMIKAVGEVKGTAIDKLGKLDRFNIAFGFYNAELSVSFITLGAELVGNHDSIEPEIRRIYKKQQDFMASLVVQGKREKIFRRALDPQMVAQALIAFQDGTLLRWFMDRDTMDGRAYVNTCSEIFLKGLIEPRMADVLSP